MTEASKPSEQKATIDDSLSYLNKLQRLEKENQMLWNDNRVLSDKLKESESKQYEMNMMFSSAGLKSRIRYLFTGRL